MSQENFIKPLLDGANSFYRVGLKQFSWQKKLQGTKCLVSRLVTESKYKHVFGSTVSSTMIDDEERDEFPYVVLINMNDMLKIYQKSINQLDFYDNEDVLKLGDVIRFSREGQEFRFKVVDVQTFSEAERVLNRYTISGMTEVNSTR